MAKVHEEEAIEILRKFVSRYGGLFAVIGAGTGFFYRQQLEFERMREASKRLEGEFTLLRSDYVDRRDFGPNGFLHPQTRAGLDAHIREALRAFNSELETRTKSWRKQLRQLNPAINLPEE